MPKPKSTYQADNDEPSETLPPLDPIIVGLLERLPVPGDVFTPQERALWLQILGLVFQLIYLEKEEAGGSEPE